MIRLIMEVPALKNGERQPVIGDAGIEESYPLAELRLLMSFFTFHI